MDDELPSGSVLPALLVTLFGLALLGVGVLLLMPFLMRASTCSNRSACASNLRQLALAASAYASDKRFYPHVGGLKQLDGDWETQDALRVYEALFHFGYLDSTDVVVCPSSFEIADPPTPGSRWTFAQVPPEAADWTPLDPRQGLATPAPLSFAQHVSYGWTRRPLNTNARGAVKLGADRALASTSPTVWEPGNHADGWNVARVDCSTGYLGAEDPSAPFTTLGATAGPDAGYLALEWAGANPFGKTPPR